MDGVLTVKGFKFAKDLNLNLQNKTIITGNSYIASELFNMFEQYFNKKNFSDYYLQQDISLVFNGRVLPMSEYMVFRARPIINLADELKITKKSLLGQIANDVFKEKQACFSAIVQSINVDILSKMNHITQEYGIHFASECEDIFSIAKIMTMQTREQEYDIFFHELEQIQTKLMFVNLVEQLKTDKKKMLLIELPEYGLKATEVGRLFSELNNTTIDKVIVFTQDIQVMSYTEDVFNYHVATDDDVLGFEDYDYLEKLLLDVNTGIESSQISRNVLQSIFPSAPLTIDNELNNYVIKFLYCKNNT